MKRQNSTRGALPELPVNACVPALGDALRAGHAVLAAEPGSGKTTLLPLLLRDEPWLGGRRILMLEPRRPAARMAARRMADLLGQQVGDEVGYQVRFERHIGDDTRIEVLTEGLLLRRLQSDPELNGVGLVIFDEFHERNLHADLSLALCLDVCAGLREDLRLLAMSASLDTAPLADLMAARVISVDGRGHPVEVRYAEYDGEPRQQVVAAMRALSRALHDGDGDVLVFLPGRREIERMRGDVDERWGDEVDVQTLFGDMPAAAQDAVLGRRAARRRVILSTDIAESSLTIDGIAAVVDSGLARKPLFDANTGLTRLETRWISKASALQRAGRAGRLGPGRCYRAWSPARQARLDDWTAAEITTADLAPLVLELAGWGVTSADALRWLDMPPEGHWRQAGELLRQLGAVDAYARITPIGRDMLRLPAHPRLAHLLVMADGREALQRAADMAALLSERDPWRRGRDGSISADLELRLDALDRLRAGSSLPDDVDRAALRHIDRAARQLRRLADDRRPGVGAVDAGELLALAYPDRVALCSDRRGTRYLMRNGRGALLDDGDRLCGSRYLVVAAVDAGRRDGRIWLAAALDDAAFERAFAAQITTAREVRWDAARADVVARRVRRLDALLLDDEADALRVDDPTAEILIAQIRAQGIGAFFDDPAELRARVELMRRLSPDEAWPDFSDRGLLDGLDRLLAPWLKPGLGIRQLRSFGLEDVLLSELGWARRQRLDADLPAHFDTPAGTRRRIEYRSNDDPVLAVPLQEMLGLSRGPKFVGGQVTPVLHLLSPAGRPLQVTRDLAAFWRGAYAEVKKEMRGRYPKHYWPDDPASAQATRHTKRRM